jgi:hypothetical protein
MHLGLIRRFAKPHGMGCEEPSASRCCRRRLLATPGGDVVWLSGWHGEILRGEFHG